MSMVGTLEFHEFAARVTSLYATPRYSRNTRLKVSQVLREVAALGASSTGDLTTEFFARYVASKSKGSDGEGNPNTINGLLGYAATICAHAVDEGWLAKPPKWSRLRLRPAPMKRNLPASYAAIGRLLANLAERRSLSWVDHRLAALVWTVALTGLRRDEALRLRCVDFTMGANDDDAGHLEVSPRERRKTIESARVVPVPPELAAVLDRWLPEAQSIWLFPGVKRLGPWTGGGPGGRALHALQRAAQAVGIERITWHSLRHAYGTYGLEQWGLPVWVVQRVLGHTDSRTTEHYLHLDRSPAIDRAARAISYGAPRHEPITIPLALPSQ